MPVKAEEIHNEHRKIDKHTLVLYKCGGGGGVACIRQTGINYS
jgi:hypothetical protein